MSRLAKITVGAAGLFGVFVLGFLFGAQSLEEADSDYCRRASSEAA